MVTEIYCLIKVIPKSITRPCFIRTKASIQFKNNHTLSLQSHPGQKTHNEAKYGFIEWTFVCGDSGGSPYGIEGHRWISWSTLSKGKTEKLPRIIRSQITLKWTWAFFYLLSFGLPNRMRGLPGSHFSPIWSYGLSKFVIFVRIFWKIMIIEAFINLLGVLNT